MNDSSPKEVRRLIFSTLRTASELASRHRIPLGEVRKLSELAYYQRARQEGLDMKKIGEKFSVGMSKVGGLSRELKKHFLEADQEYGLPRHILSLLWATPLTELRITRVLPGYSAEEISKALETLLQDGRVRRVKGRTDRFALTGKQQRLSTSSWIARLDGLNTLMDHLTLVIRARFQGNEADAMVRNVSFRVKKGDGEKLQRFYEEQLFPLICALDEAAGDDEGSREMKLSMLWSPTDVDPKEDPNRG